MDKDVIYPFKRMVTYPTYSSQVLSDLHFAFFLLRFQNQDSGSNSSFRELEPESLPKVSQ